MNQREMIRTAALLLCAAGCSPPPEERSVAAAISDAPQIGMPSEREQDEQMPPMAESDVVLHDQTATMTGYGITSQDFTVANAYDSEAADDFAVPVGQQWIVRRVEARGHTQPLGTVLLTVHVRFYRDASGVPALAPLHEQRFVTIPGSSGDLTISLPTPVTLASGHYWVSVQARHVSDAQWYWRERDTLFPGSRPSAWRNPGGAFGVGCNTWTPRISGCGVGFAPDLAFRLIGESQSDGPDPSAPLIALTFDGLSSGSARVPNAMHERWMDGLMHGAPAIVPNDGGNAVRFDGIDDFVDIPNSSHLDFSQGWRVELDFRYEGATMPNRRIVSAGASWQLYYYEAGGQRFLNFQASGLGEDLRFHLAAGEDLRTWNHLVLSYSPGALVIQLNSRSETWQVTLESAHQDLHVGIGNNGASNTLFQGIIDDVRVFAGRPACYPLEPDVEPDGLVVVTKRAHSSASTTFCQDPTTFVRGEIVHLSVPEEVAGYRFFDWRRVGADAAWHDTHVEDGDEFAFADIFDDGELSPIERRAFGWMRQRYRSEIALVMLDDASITASFLSTDDVPTITVFPVNGPHDTGYFPDLQGFHCALDAELHSNSDCHDGGAIDISAERGTPVVAAQSGTIHFDCDVCGGLVAYIDETSEAGRTWRHYYAHLNRTCFRHEGNPVENPCSIYPPDSEVPEGCDRPRSYEPADSALPEDCQDEYFANGAEIAAGQVIGFVGNTGTALQTGAHLHYTAFRPDEERRPEIRFPSCTTVADSALADWATDSKWINIYPFLLDHELDSCEAPQVRTGVDLVIAIDTTGSMAGILAAIQAAADPLLQYMESRLGPGLRVSIVDYRDEPRAPWGGAQDYRLDVRSGLSSDRAATLAAIRGLDIGWGGDWPESVFSALIGVLQGQDGAIDWRPGADKFIVLIGDAPPHLLAEPYAPNYSFVDVIAAIWALAGQAAASPASGLDASDAPAPPLAIQSVVVGDSPDTLSAFAHLATETGGGLLVAADENAIVATLMQAVDDMAAAASPDQSNRPPDAQLARPSIDRLWPPSHGWHEVAILEVTDPDGDPVRLTITGITQDEPVSSPGAGHTGPDASGIGRDRAQLRAERDGRGNGRVYEITFLATDGRGGRSTGSVRVCVPRDQKPGSACGDDGQDHDATLP